MSTSTSSGQATKSSVASANASTALLAANPLRKGAIITNESTALLYIDLTGGTASATSYSVVLAATAASVSAFYELKGTDVYTGPITGFWAAANGNARVTEIL